MNFDAKTGQFVIVTKNAEGKIDVWLDNMVEPFKSFEEANDFKEDFAPDGEVVEMKYFFLP